MTARRLRCTAVEVDEERKGADGTKAAALVLLMALSAWSSSCGSDQVSEETRQTLLVRHEAGELVWPDPWYEVPTEPYGLTALEERGVLKLVIEDADAGATSIFVPFSLITVVYIRGEFSHITVMVVEASLSSHVDLAEKIAVAMGSDASHLRAWAADPSQRFGQYGHRLVPGPVNVHVEIRGAVGEAPTWYMRISFTTPRNGGGADRNGGEGLEDNLEEEPPSTAE